MDRIIVYPGSIPLDTDLLSTNRNAMVAVAALSAATLGTTPTIDGLTVQPSGQGGLAVDVSPGSIAALQPLEGAAYGSLPADLNDAIVKTGINVGTVTLALAAPTSNGYAITYLIQAAVQESDVNPVVLPYYNAANPNQPFLGPNNNGVAQPTLRSTRVALGAKGGIAAAAGSSAAPAPDVGWVGLATVTVGYGQSSIAGNAIAPWQALHATPFKLPELRPGFASVQAFGASGQFVVPVGVSRLRVTVIGGGGAGGTHATLPSGGGGAGGWATGWLANLTAGSVIPVTVGPGGQAQAGPQNGPSGGTSAFGIYLAASGGQGGGGGTVQVVPAGGAGGQGYGGQTTGGGSYGTDGIPIVARGGDGGGPGGGRGASYLSPGIFATGPGGGGGGGGASQPNGGTGAPGGSGANGLVIVEYRT